jgi:hypothetical protein
MLFLIYFRESAYMLSKDSLDFSESKCYSRTMMNKKQIELIANALIPLI